MLLLDFLRRAPAVHAQQRYHQRNCKGRADADETARSGQAAGSEGENAAQIRTATIATVRSRAATATAAAPLVHVNRRRRRSSRSRYCARPSRGFMQFPYRRVICRFPKTDSATASIREQCQHPPPEFRVHRRACSPCEPALRFRGYSRILPQIQRFGRDDGEIRLPPVRDLPRPVPRAHSLAGCRKSLLTGTGKLWRRADSDSVSRRLSSGPMISTGTFFSFDCTAIRRMTPLCTFRGRCPRRPSRASSVRERGATPAAAEDYWRHCRKPRRRSIRVLRPLCDLPTAANRWRTRQPLACPGDSGRRLERHILKKLHAIPVLPFAKRGI